MWNQKEKRPTYGNSRKSGGGAGEKRARQLAADCRRGERRWRSGPGAAAEGTAASVWPLLGSRTCTPPRNGRKVSEGVGVPQTCWGALSRRKKPRVSGRLIVPRQLVGFERVKGGHTKHVTHAHRHEFLLACPRDAVTRSLSPLPSHVWHPPVTVRDPQTLTRSPRPERPHRCFDQADPFP